MPGYRNNSKTGALVEDQSIAADARRLSDNGCLVFQKGSNAQVGKYFKASEMDCPCSGCSYTFVHPLLIARLDKLRDLIGAKVVIDKGGGYRCDYYQQQLREKGYETAKGRSQHQDGKAADIRSDSRSGADLTVFAAEAGFCAIGTAKHWIHVDTRPEMHRWTYST